VNSLKREERVLNTIYKKDIDFLPSQITFSDRTRLGELAKVMNFKDAEEVEEYLQNHIKLSSLNFHAINFVRYGQPKQTSKITCNLKEFSINRKLLRN